MLRIKNSIIATIERYLENSHFGSANFNIETFDRGQTLITITFLPFAEYTFSIKHKPDIYTFIECPGEVEYIQKKTYNPSDFNSFYDRIKDWCGNIYTEIKYKSFKFDNLNKIKEQLEQNINKKYKNLDQPFDKNEIPEWEIKLNDLYSKFEELQKSHAITKKELEKIKHEFKNIKNDITLFPKGIWLKTTGYKIIGIISKVAQSKIGQKLLEYATDTLLGK